SLELQDVINQELSENPALDLEEIQVCPLCGQSLTGRVCVNCFGIGSRPYKGGEDVETEPLEGTSLLQRDEEEDELDPIVRAEAEQTLAEYLSWNTRVLLPRRLHPVAEYIIGNLNDNGYLEIAIEEIAKTMKVSIADATEALRTIQSIEPWGIGARDTRECLLIQIDHLTEIGEEIPEHARAGHDRGRTATHSPVRDASQVLHRQHQSAPADHRADHRRDRRVPARLPREGGPVTAPAHTGRGGGAHRHARVHRQSRDGWEVCPSAGR